MNSGKLTKQFKPQKGDVLLTKGGTTGFAKAVNFEYEFCVWVHLAILRPNNKVIPLYLEHALNSDYCYWQSQKLTKGIANRDLGLKRIARIRLLVPPKELQHQFATIVEKTESLKTRYQQNLTELENLYGTLSQKAFKGELDLSRVPWPEKATHHEGHEDHEENKEKNLRDLRGASSQTPVDEIDRELIFDDDALGLPETTLPRNLLQLFEDFISKQTGDFSLDSFWQNAEQTLLESTDEDLKLWNVDDYDQVKQRLFELVKNGKIKQGFNETGNRIELSSTGGVHCFPAAYEP